MRGSLRTVAVTAAAVTLPGSVLAGGAPAGAAVLGPRAAPGAQPWAARFPASGYFQVSVLAVSSRGGRAFVTGASYGGRATGTDYQTVAYSTAGRQLWTSRYSGPGHQEDDPAAVAVGPDGTTVYVTGNGDGDYGTAAYRAATGKQVWASRYPNGAAFSMAVSPSGTTVYVTGNIVNRTTDAYTTIAYRG
jgi:hypothetical protein